jgi:transcriptional regulator
MNEHYPRKPFRIRSRETLCEVMRTYPLATLVSGIAGSATITLVPMLVDIDEQDDIVLTGHIDRNNEHTRLLQRGKDISFQFLGPESYASPDLYPDPHLPGWLYVSVQGDGVVSATLDDVPMRDTLVRSAGTFGDARQVFSLDPGDPRVAQFLPYVHGFRITVNRISGIAKLAQDKGPVDSRIAMNFLADQDNAGSRALFERLLLESGIPP